MRNIKKFSQDNRGVTLVEYGVALVLAVGIGTASLSALANAVNDQVDAARTEME